MGVGSGGGGGVGSGGNGGVGSGDGGGGVGSGGPGGVSNEEFAMARVVIPDPSMRRSDLGALHPTFRESVVQLLASFQQEELPFQLYEGFRTPQRQAWLYQQGRTRPGSIITESDAWGSYHQYGLAADFVLWVNGAWTWSTLGVNESRWKRLRDLGKSAGLEPRGSELPHLQVAGLDLKKLQTGKFPPGGDDSWQDNLEAAAISWKGKPPAPPVTSARPALSPIPARPARKR